MTQVNDFDQARGLIDKLEQRLQTAEGNDAADAAAIAELKRLYAFAENQRKEFWRLYNSERIRLGIPKQPGSTPYTLEQWNAELAKLPATTDPQVDSLKSQIEALVAERTKSNERETASDAAQDLLKKAIRDAGIKLPS